MNGRKAKQLRRRSEDLLIEWLRTMVPEGEDTSKINRKNLEEFLNKKGLAIILGGDDVSLKFVGTIQAKAYGIKDEIDIVFDFEIF